MKTNYKTTLKNVSKKVNKLILFGLLISIFTLILPTTNIEGKENENVNFTIEEVYTSKWVKNDLHKPQVMNKQVNKTYFIDNNRLNGEYKETSLLSYFFNFIHIDMDLMSLNFTSNQFILH